MKKLKKLLAVVSSITMIACNCFTNVFAETETPTLKNALYYFKYNNRIMDGVFINNEGIRGFYISYGDVILTLPEGEEPILENEDLTITKIDESYFTSNWNGIWGHSTEINDEITDNMYAISGFDSLEEKKEFCRNAMKDKKAISANIVEKLSTAVFICSIGHSSNFPEGFEEGYITMELIFKDEETAQAFNPESIDILNENLLVTCTEENTVLCQLNYYSQIDYETADCEKVAEILNTIEENEDISIRLIGGCLESTGDSSNGLMSAFDSGDVNFDTNIDLYDAIDIAKYLMNSKEFNGEQLFLGDVNEDGTCDLYDAIEIAKTLIK